MAHTPAGNDTHYRQYDYVLECINEYEPSDDLQNLLVPKQELPVIPKYVAKYLEFAKKEASLIQVMVIVSEGCPTMKKEFDWISENDETFARAWLDGYTVEEPLYYALIKGHELMTDDGDWACKYWNLSIPDGRMFPNDRFSRHGDYLTEMTKAEWSKWGVNDSNANFVKVEELEE